MLRQPSYLEVLMRGALILLVVTAGVVGCNSTTMKPDPFAPVPECTGAAVTPLRGSRQLVISSLGIADYGEGFDLDLNGTLDNKLAPLGALANEEIKKAFTGSYEIVIPFELFGYDGNANSECTKTAFYIGEFNQDRDGDGRNTSPDDGDCLDTDANVRPGKAEDLTNRLDDDCDGISDNMVKGVRPSDTQDLDLDGFTLAMGDCDDRDGANMALAASRHPGAAEICGDGIDQNCDGIPDNDPKCLPFAQNAVTMRTQSTSFDKAGKPIIVFNAGTVKDGQLNDGPSIFAVTVPISGREIALELRGARLRMTLSDNFAVKQTNAKDGILAGVLQGQTLSQIKGIEAGGVIKKDQSLLDAVFVGPVGPILGLDSDKEGNYTPDIDVDGDGLETFLSTVKPGYVDTCVDGDGTRITGTVDAPCALAKNADGSYRFVDGLSVALKFQAVPVKLDPMIVQK